jgi:hypothetical protein
MSLINFYELLPDSLKPVKQQNLGFENHGITLPCRILISGSSNAGKTLSILNYLRLARTKTKGQYDHIHIFTKKNEPLYEFMKLKNPSCVTIHEMGSDDEFPKVEDFDGSKSHFVIFDDLIGDKKLSEKVIPFFIRGRKLRPNPLNMCFITQDFRATPATLRKNMTHLWLFKPSTEREKKMIAQDVPLLKDGNLWRLVSQKANESDPNNFINVDLNKDTARINFSKLK